MQPIALECMVYCRWGRLVSASTDMHAPHNHSASTRNHMQLGTDPFLYLHLFIYFPFHRVSWFSASFIFRRSALFFHLCHVFSVILLSILAVRKGEEGVREAAAAVYSRQTADVLQLFSGPCDAGDAAEGLRCPAKSAIFCPYPPRSVHQCWAASVSQRRGWVRGKNETGGGASSETLYDALVIRGRLFLLAFPWSAIRAVTST